MNKELKTRIFKLLMTFIMLILGIVFMLPFFWMISTSMKPEVDVFQYPIQWIPHHWQAIQNYKEVWFGKHPFSLYYWNSIKVSLGTVALSVTVSSLAAYGFSIIPFKGRNVLFAIILLTYMIPQQAILVPQFILFRELKLFNSLLGLVFLGSFSVLGTFMLRQFFLGIHQDFIESAKIDGAGHLRIFTQIAVPLVKPAIATYAILRFIWTWNDYQNPLIFLRSEKLFTVQVAINQFADMNGKFYSLIMAGTVSAIIPLLIVFVFGQRYVIEGIAAGGVKG